MVCIGGRAQAGRIVGTVYRASATERGFTLPPDNRSGLRMIVIPFTSEHATASAGGVDPHGRAALLLAESMVHALVDRGVLSNDEAIEVVAIACEVAEEQAEGTPDLNDGAPRAADLLKAIRAGFDIGDGRIAAPQSA